MNKPDDCRTITQIISLFVNSIFAPKLYVLVLVKIKTRNGLQSPQRKQNCSILITTLIIVSLISLWFIYT